MPKHLSQSTGFDYYNASPLLHPQVAPCKLPLPRELSLALQPPSARLDPIPPPRLQLNVRVMKPAELPPSQSLSLMPDNRHPYSYALASTFLFIYFAAPASRISLPLPFSCHHSPYRSCESSHAAPDPAHRQCVSLPRASCALCCEPVMQHTMLIPSTCRA